MTAFRDPIVYDNPGHVLHGVPWGLVQQAHTLFSVDRVSGFASDFHTYGGPPTSGSLGGWELTEIASGGTNRVDVDDSVNGILRIATGSSDNDLENLQLQGESFKYILGKRLWCAARLAVTDADDGEAWFGLATADTSLIAGVVDGIYFSKTETGTDFTFNLTQDSVTTSAACGLTLTDSGFVVLGFAVDTGGVITMFAEDDATAGSATLTGGTVMDLSDDVPTDEELTLGFAIQTGAASSKSLLVDWVVVAQER